MSTIRVNTLQNTSTTDGGISIDNSGHVTVDGVAMPSAGALSNRNLIINGAQTIDQRNAGSSVTPTNAQYLTDRWKVGATQSSKFTAQQSTTAPAGFKNSLLLTSSSAYTLTSSDEFEIIQFIEGNNVAHLGFGTADAQTLTLSFYVRSSLTGTFGGCIYNGSANRSYPFTYSISSADTWERQTVTFAGDTSGTWATDNTAGINVLFSLGAGSNNLGTAGAWTGSFKPGATGQTNLVATNGATLYLTGVQLEVGSVATPFEHRSFGDELARCQRYFQKTFAINTAPAQNAGRAGALETYAVRGGGANGLSSYFRFTVPMRATPTMTYFNPSANNAQARNLDTTDDCSSTGTDNMNQVGGKANYTLPAGTASTNLISVHWTASAEL